MKEKDATVKGSSYQLGFRESVGVFVVLQLQPLIRHKLKGAVRCSKQARDKSLKGRIKKKKNQIAFNERYT